ncbi:MAG: ABC transporter ATP-binding protein [Eubacteriales bacterium]|nr:ABC transporter ATP-binding protein [Eubacteriales bacterium]
MDETGPIIQTKELKMHYRIGDNVVKALDGVDISILRGEFIAVSGRSGSGKTTFLNMLAGLDPPTSGKVYILGKDLGAMDEEERTRFRRKYIGFVFQNYNILPQYTALENVALPLAVRGIEKEKRERLALQALERVGLRGHAAHKPSELSGGQQQRVSIARAIITKPAIVLADEPTGNLDSSTGREIMELLCRIFKESGTTFVISSHDPAMQQYTERTVRFADGKIYTEENVEGISSEEE